MIPHRLPLFQFGCGSTVLGCISGPLIFDSGEAENTFFFRCQDRFLAYNLLSGIRPVLFVIDRDHRDRYLELLVDFTTRLAAVSKRTGTPLRGAIEPYFVPLDPDTLRVGEAGRFLDPPRPSGGGVVFNQVSPTCADIFRQLHLPNGGLSQLTRIGALALRWHNKAEYVKLVESRQADLPPHARTMVLEASEFLAIRDWEDLRSLFPGIAADALYVKSTRDSGGNLAARITRENCAGALAHLRGEIAAQTIGERSGSALLAGLRSDIALAPSLRHVAWTDAQLLAYLRSQLQRRAGLQILVQESVESSEAAPFQGIGITCDAQSGALFATGQLYRDCERRHFIGSYIHEATSASILTPRFAEEMRHLCALFAQEGYRGPLGFDARRGPGGDWVLIYDCNPRLTAVYPGLAVFQYLQRNELPCDSVISLGYRGEWDGHSLNEWMDRLEAAGLLYGKSSTRGVLPLPNMARDGGCDLVIVNVRPSELLGLFDTAGLAATHFQVVY